MKPLEYTVLCPFGGSGGGALGFLAAEARLLGHVGRFRCLGSIDFDALACEDFARFTKSDAWHVDIETVSGAQLVERYGRKAPDVVFMSPPCKGSSRLLSSKKAATEKYVAMNKLALVWTRAMLAAWGESPPALVLLENVPGLPTRAAAMLRELRATLKSAGYVFHASTHDCGEIGGLAQRRQRYLLVARHPKKCPSLLYQPPAKRVRGVGEVLGELPMPATRAAQRWGALHTMPKLSWKNWLRLALIPAGGDWRDLEGVLAEGQARREVFRRHPVQSWDDAAPAITGPGGHSVEGIADPRVSMNPRPGNWSTFGVTPWDEPSATVAGESAPSNGRFSVADPRIQELPVGVPGDGSKDTDPHPRGGLGTDRALSLLLDEPGFDAAYGVLGWNAPARTIAGNTAAGCGGVRRRGSARSPPRRRARDDARRGPRARARCDQGAPVRARDRGARRHVAPPDDAPRAVGAARLPARGRRTADRVERRTHGRRGAHREQRPAPGRARDRGTHARRPGRGERRSDVAVERRGVGSPDRAGGAGMSTLDLFEPARLSGLSQWFSPAWIARRLALWLPVEAEGYVLEPSAGSGELVEGLVRAGWPIERIVAVEIDPRWCAHLRTRFPGLHVIEGDFMAPDIQRALGALLVRHALLNPPYEGGLDVSFLELCLRLVGPRGRACALVKTDIEYSSVRAPFWRGVARAVRRARLVERPAFGSHVDGKEQGGAERNYVCLELALRSAPRAPGEVETVAEEAWSRTDHESVWTRSTNRGEPLRSPTNVADLAPSEPASEPANRERTDEGGCA